MPGQQLQQRALARSVVPDDAQAFSLLHAQVDVFQRFDGHLLLAFAKEAVQQEILEARALPARTWKCKLTSSNSISFIAGLPALHEEDKPPFAPAKQQRRDGDRAGRNQQAGLDRRDRR